MECGGELATVRAPTRHHVVVRQCHVAVSDHNVVAVVAMSTAIAFVTLVALLPLVATWHMKPIEIDMNCTE